MELAFSDLQQLVSRPGWAEAPTPTSYLLCFDIANGLDAIHESKLVHGDLKPTNVLIFPTRTNRPMAKLADFGLSVDDLESSNLGGAGLGGTPGWQAPEVVEDRALTVEKLFKADNYSFGLLVWYIMLGLEGNAVPPCTSGTPQDIWIDNGIAKSQYP